jgi:DHA2 family multidrug resistance protein-like MFS transporter
MSDQAAASAATSAPPRSSPASVESARRSSAIFAVLSAMTLVVLDAGVANIALPSLSRTLDVAPSAAILVVTAYQTGLIMALLPAGALGERFGHARVFSIGVAIFAVASGLCATAPSLLWLAAARWLQGLGGAMVMALGVALLRFTVSNDRLGSAIGWNALTVALASAAAPGVGAFILSIADWPALFAINLPLAAATLLAARSLPATPRKATAPGLADMALNAAAFGLFVLAAEYAPRQGRASALLFVGAACAFVFLIVRARGEAEPLIPLDLLARRSFSLSVAASVCCFAGQSIGLVALPFLLQHELGQSPLAAGLYITAWPLSVAATAPIAGRLADRVSTARLCAAGGVCLATGLAGVAALPAGRPALLLPCLALAGLGFGLFQTPNNRNMFLSAPASRSGAAGGMQGAARVTGQIIGALVISALFALPLAETGPRRGLAIGAALALVAAIVSLGRASGKATGVSANPASPSDGRSASARRRVRNGLDSGRSGRDRSPRGRCSNSAPPPPAT